MNGGGTVLKAGRQGRAGCAEAVDCGQRTGGERVDCVWQQLMGKDLCSCQRDCPLSVW